jgi:transketolase
MKISDEKITELKRKSNFIRQLVIKMLLEAGSGHTAGPLGMADIFTYLYFVALHHDPQKPQMEDRDRLILSNGHICPVLYATMAHAGYFPLDELQTLRKFNSRLQGHPHREFLSYLETSSGPLGSGLSQAVGMAIADRVDNGNNSNKYFYCLMSDGELNEGQSWEAIMFAGKEKNHNLIAIVDKNNIQISGYTKDVMPLDDLKKKFESFNWHTQEIDGHNFEAIDDSIREARSVFDKPSVIIAHTIPGKGVSEFEGKYEWHGKVPNKEQAERALKELKSLI